MLSDFYLADSYAFSTVLFITTNPIVNTLQSRLLKTVTHITIRGQHWKSRHCYTFQPVKSFRNWTPHFQNFISRSFQCWSEWPISFSIL